MNVKPLRIVIAGGGTGGHVQPALAVATTLREMADVDLSWIGSNTGVERDAATNRGIPFYSIPTGKLRRYLSLYTVSDVVRIPFGILRARMLLRSIQPDVVFSTGGFVSVPTVIAAWLAGIPIITHEQTATVGLANRINARFADRIALAFEVTTAEFPGKSHRLVVTGNPVRPELVGGDGERARRELNLPDDCPVVYVTGGSLGAHAINNTLRTLIPELSRASVVIHQCGPSSANGDFPRLLELRQQLPADLQQRYVVRERLGDELAHVYALADLVVGRAGAGTVAELSFLGKPSILIPLPGASADEQTQNARVLEKARAAVLLSQAALTPELLLNEISALLNDRERLKQMADAARTVAEPDAARLLANEIVALAENR